MFTSEVIGKMSKSEVELTSSERNQEKRVEDVKSNENNISSDNQSLKAFDFESETINYRGRNDFDPSQANFEDFMFSMLMNS